MKLYDSYLHPKYSRKPDIGEIFVSLDPQNRLGPLTWLVAIMGDGTSQGDTVQLGLFWNRDKAIGFAEMIEDKAT